MKSNAENAGNSDSTIKTSDTPAGPAEACSSGATELPGQNERTSLSEAKSDERKQSSLSPELERVIARNLSRAYWIGFEDGRRYHRLELDSAVIAPPVAPESTNATGSVSPEGSAEIGDCEASQ